MYKYVVGFMCVVSVANNFGANILAKSFQRKEKDIRGKKKDICKQKEWNKKNLEGIAPNEIVKALKTRVKATKFTRLNGVNLAHCNFSKIDMDDWADFINCTVDASTNFEGVVIRGRTVGTDLRKAKLTGANLDINIIVNSLLSESTRNQIITFFGKEGCVPTNGYLEGILFDTERENYQFLADNVSRVIQDYRLNCTVLIAKKENGRVVGSWSTWDKELTKK